MSDEERITPVFTPLLPTNMSPVASFASSSPPTYRRHSVQPISPETEHLPAYSRRSRRASRLHVRTTPPQKTNHVFELSNSKNRPWATLSVQSCARSTQQMPTFFEDEPIAGTVALNLEKEDSITAVTVSVTGKIVTGAKSGDVYTFMTYSEPLWSRAMGDPHTSSPSSSPGSASRFNGKLSGSYSWPFSFTLPKKVTLQHTSAEPPQTYRLPQTFLERLTIVSVQYDLTVNITRTKLRPDSQLQTVLAYIPCTKPREPSMLRQLAYRESSPLLLPEMDPEGWHALPTVPIKGRIFSSHQVNIDLNLSLATPLCYTRGTVIPLYLTLSSQDRQALDLLSSPHAINIRLRRRVRYYISASNVASYKQTGSAERKDAIDFVENAVWWPAPGGDRHSRRLNGEIRLAKDLKPTSSMAHFTIDYSVVVCPFQAAGFSCRFDSTEQPLSTVPVEIATMFARGPRPKAYAPPCYDSVRRKSAVYMSPSAGLAIADHH
jgi:hypothetical protein